jgi:hypothetical protein
LRFVVVVVVAATAGETAAAAVVAAAIVFAVVAAAIVVTSLPFHADPRTKSLVSFFFDFLPPISSLLDVF